ncbi:LysR family transcriptional regulator [Nesterenkonia haasae]|uniref:LysR family transcriptional regulator n=1 Tax=Nesterenkonia haasae TaxID=2587813 RepID=UPI001390D408|nr:LysR family transcriptional regulator [Nesterenkonia haasae]
MTHVKFTLRQLDYFIAASELGTLSAAAERCNVSQVGLGVALTELERATGVQLFLRKRAKGVILTPEGRGFLPAARSIMTQSAELQATVTSHIEKVAGPLRIGCLTGLASMIMPDVCELFAAQYPALRIEFRDGSQRELQELLEKGVIDVAFLYEREIPDTLDSKHLIEMKPHVLISADDPLAERTDVVLSELAHLPRIRLSVLPLAQPLDGRGSEQGKKNEVLEASSVELVRTLVGRGLGFAILAQRSATNFTAEQREVRTLEFRDDVPSVSVVLAYPRGMILPRRIQALIEFVHHTWSHDEPTA